jgi:hypothetical protein
VSYSVRGWFISNTGTQAGLLVPMTLINLASLSLLITCFVIGKFRYKYDFDATDNTFLLAASVDDMEDEEIEWGDKVKYRSMNHVPTCVSVDGLNRGALVDGRWRSGQGCDYVGVQST